MWNLSNIRISIFCFGQVNLSSLTIRDFLLDKSSYRLEEKSNYYLRTSRVIILNYSDIFFWTSRVILEDKSSKVSGISGGSTASWVGAAAPPFGLDFDIFRAIFFRKFALLSHPHPPSDLISSFF